MPRPFVSGCDDETTANMLPTTPHEEMAVREACYRVGYKSFENRTVGVPDRDGKTPREKVLMVGLYDCGTNNARSDGRGMFP